MKRWIGVLGAVAVLLGACSNGDSDGGSTTNFGHVHGLGVGSGGVVYVATHHGLYRIDAQHALQPVGEQRRDLMGFTVLDPQTFLSSGHPAPGEDADNPLGVVVSHDAGTTWSTVALSGEVDFHALDVAGSAVYGYDAANQRLMVSADGGRRWEQRADLGAADIAVDPAHPTTVLATTRDGVVTSRDGGLSFQEGDTPLLAFITWSRDRTVYALDTSAGLHTSTDGGATWQRQADVPGGGPQAITAVADGRVLAATEGGVYAIRDGGRTVEVLATAEND